MNETNNKALTAKDFLDKHTSHSLVYRTDMIIDAMHEFSDQQTEAKTAALKEENERLKKEVCLFYSIQVKNLELQQQLSTMVEALETARKLILGGSVAFTAEDEALYNEKVLSVIKAYRQSKNEKGGEG